MKALFKHPLFGAGLALRLLLIVAVLPAAATEWYVPFLENSVQYFTLDPYHTFLSADGVLRAFPYGYVMWFAFLPLTALCYVANVPVYWGYGLTLLAADTGLLIVLKNLVTISDRRLLLAYWWSPILLFAAYWLGLNDIIPVFFLCLALLHLRRLRATSAGALCGAAISAKLSMLLAAPLFVIYLYRKKALRHLLKPFLAGLALATGVFGVPFLVSPDALRMLFSNPEMEKIYTLAINGGSGATFYILPMAYLLMVYTAWHIRRLSFDLFFALLGISFFLVLLLTPAAPGWFLWVLPLLVFYQAISGRFAVALAYTFTLLYVACNFLAMEQPVILGSLAVNHFAADLESMLGERGQGLLNTALLTMGLVIMFRIWLATIRANDFFRISRRSFVVGIAGDSGAGKDTLVQSLTGLLGRHSVAALSGDDYHFWDRHKPMWQAMTHLNPRANDLQQFARDAIALADGKSIQKPHYDHVSGRKSKNRCTKSNDFILVSGLHALYLPILRERYDLGIYLAMDERLRRYFKLLRDVKQRNGTVENVMAALERREKDARQFIRPQEAHAGLVLSLQPLHAMRFDETEDCRPLRLKLGVRGRYGLHEEALVRTLVGVCGLHVEMDISGDNSAVSLTIEGDVSAEDIGLAARELFPDMVEMLDTRPQWKDGMEGLMQLVVLSHINQAMRRRTL